jgi:hypothetical protein
MKWLLALPAAVAISMAQTPVKLGAFTFTGNIRTRVELWDWYDAEAASRYNYNGTLFRFGIGQQKKWFDWQAEFAAPVLINLPEASIAAGNQGQLGMGASYFAANGRVSNKAMLFPKQVLVRFKALGGDEQQSLKIGRMEFIDGTETTPKDATLAALKRDRIAHRLLGNFGWTHAGRSFDGALYSLQRGATNVTVLGAIPTRGVFQVDGWGWVETPILYAAVTRAVGGGNSAGELRVFGLGYWDGRSVLKTDPRPLAARRADVNGVRIATFGGHYLHHFTTSGGQFDALGWFAGQTGSWGVQSHRAAAYAIEGGFQPKWGRRLKPWLRGGYNASTGDADPNDRKHGTFFQVLPTPRVYARFPFFNLMNTQDAFGEAILRPSKQWTIRADVHSLRLTNANDLWYLGGGAFQPWTFGYTGRTSGGRRGLATLYDLSADYAVNARVTLGGYFAYASGRGVMESIYPKAKDARLGTIEMTYRF